MTNEDASRRWALSPEFPRMESALAYRESLLAFVRRIASRPCTKQIEPERACIHCEAAELLEKASTT